MPANRKPTQTLGSGRIIQLFGDIDEKSAKEVINRLIGLDKKSNKDILILIDSCGGELDAMVSMYQTTKLLRCDVATLALANASSAAALLLASGTPGKRLVMPESIVMMHDISTELSKDYHGVLENELQSLRIAKTILQNMLTSHGAPDAIKLMKPEATYLMGEEAVKHHLADHVINSLADLHKWVNI